MQGIDKLSGALPPTIMEDGYDECTGSDIIYSTCRSIPLPLLFLDVEIKK